MFNVYSYDLKVEENRKLIDESSKLEKKLKKIEELEELEELEKLEKLKKELEELKKKFLYTDEFIEKLNTLKKKNKFNRYEIMTKITINYI